MGLLVHHRFIRKNTAVTLNFSLSTAAADTPYTGAAPATTDVSIILDEAVAINPAAAPVSEGVGIWSLALTAAETNGNRVSIAIDNANIDCCWIFCETALNLESVTVNNAAGSAITATSAGSNGHGIVASGNGTGAGVRAVAGATGAGLIAVGGATSGVGLSASATASSEITNIFNVTESAEPTSAITNLATMMSIFQHLKRRFFNKVTQTTTTQTMYRDDSSTSLETMAVSNDGVTQTKGKAT